MLSSVIKLIKSSLGFEKLVYVAATFNSSMFAEEHLQQIGNFWKGKEFLEKIKKPKELEQLRRQFANDARFIDKLVAFTIVTVFQHFPVVGFITFEDEIPNISKLPFVEMVHKIPEDNDYVYFDLLHRLNDILARHQANPEQGFNAVNLSLQPPRPYMFQPADPFNVATKYVASFGIVPVVAVGNFGAEGDNSLSPWSVAPWVIGVGASYNGGRKLWEKSGKGIPDHPLYHPTIVAPGVHTIDASNPEDIKFIPIQGDEKDGNASAAPKKHKIIRGTSFAVPVVTSIIGKCFEHIQNLTTTPLVAEWQAEISSEGLRQHPVVCSPIIVKRILVDMAMRMPSHKVHEVGAGYVDMDIADKYFENFDFKTFHRIFVIDDWLADEYFNHFEFENYLREFQFPERGAN